MTPRAIAKSGFRLLICCFLSIAVTACADSAKSFNLFSDDKEEAKLQKAAGFATQTVKNDPESRAIQVAWTSARAVKCGFYFDRNQLRQSFLSAEQNQGTIGDQLKKAQLTYDFTYRSISMKIKDDQQYCSSKSVEAIRKDLNRHLAGDFRPSARSQKAES